MSEPNTNTQPEEDNNKGSLVMRLTGEDAKAFMEYDSEPMSEEECRSLDEAIAVYKKHEHDGEQPRRAGSNKAKQHITEHTAVRVIKEGQDEQLIR